MSMQSGAGSGPDSPRGDQGDGGGFDYATIVKDAWGWARQTWRTFGVGHANTDLGKRGSAKFESAGGVILRHRDDRKIPKGSPRYYYQGERIGKDRARQIMRQYQHGRLPTSPVDALPPPSSSSSSPSSPPFLAVITPAFLLRRWQQRGMTKQEWERWAEGKGRPKRKKRKVKGKLAGGAIAAALLGRLWQWYSGPELPRTDRINDLRKLNQLRREARDWAHSVREQQQRARDLARGNAEAARLRRSANSGEITAPIPKAPNPRPQDSGVWGGKISTRGLPGGVTVLDPTTAAARAAARARAEAVLRATQVLHTLPAGGAGPVVSAPVPAPATPAPAPTRLPVWSRLPTWAQQAVIGGLAAYKAPAASNRVAFLPSPVQTPLTVAQTQAVPYLSQPSSSSSKTCKCAKPKKRGPPRCRNKLVSRRKRTSSGRILITTTREQTCPVSSRKKRP